MVGRPGASFVRTFLRRPTLIILVYSLCLVLVGVTASAQAGVITLRYQQTALQSVVDNDAGLIRAVVNSEVRLSDLPPAGPTEARRAELNDMLHALALRSEIVRVELRATDGTLVAGSHTVQVTANDTPSCGGPAHTRTVSYTFTVQ
jgi:hypothetical protein